MEMAFPRLNLDTLGVTPKNIFENVFLEMILQQFEVRTSLYFGVFCMHGEDGGTNSGEIPITICMVRWCPIFTMHVNTPKYGEVLLQIAIKPFLEIRFRKYFL